MARRKIIEIKDVTSPRDVIKLLKRNKDFFCAALLTLYEMQTDDEKIERKTKYENQVGFNAIDAAGLTALALAVKEKGGIAKNSFLYDYDILEKYSVQIFNSIKDGNLIEFKSVKNISEDSFWKNYILQKERLEKLQRLRKLKKKLELVNIEVSEGTIIVTSKYCQELISILHELRFNWEPEEKKWYFVASNDTNIIQSQLLLALNTLKIDCDTQINEIYKAINHSSA